MTIFFVLKFVVVGNMVKVRLGLGLYTWTIILRSNYYGIGVKCACASSGYDVTFKRSVSNLSHRKA